MELIHLMDSKETVEHKLDKVDAELKILKDVQMSLWKALANINGHLKGSCDHEWKRESYQYAPLYCAICGVSQ